MYDRLLARESVRPVFASCSLIPASSNCRVIQGSIVPPKLLLVLRFLGSYLTDSARRWCDSSCVGLGVRRGGHHLGAQRNRSRS